MPWANLCGTVSPTSFAPPDAPRKCGRWTMSPMSPGCTPNSWRKPPTTRQVLLHVTWVHG